LLSLIDCFRVAFEEEKSVISVLEHGAGTIRDDGVLDGSS
jgi:hypothetical protein